MDLSGLPTGSIEASCPACPSEDAVVDNDSAKCCGAPAPPVGKPLSAGWDGMAGWYTQWMSPGTASITASLFGHAGLLSPGVSGLKVLETHCGDARAAAGLLPCPSVASYTAVDFSEGMLEAAQANLGDDAKTVVADSTSLPFSDGSFDRYICNLGLCCTTDFTASLSEACRVLRPGGIAAMSMRIEGGEGDTSMKLINDTLTPYGMGPGPDREGVQIGKDLPALRSRVQGAGFAGAVAWRTFATLPIHDVSTFMQCVLYPSEAVHCKHKGTAHLILHVCRYATSQPPTKKFLGSLDTEERAQAEQALSEAASSALESGAIQVAIAVVVARHPDMEPSAL